MGKLLIFLALFAVLGSLAWWYIGADSYILIRLGEWTIQLQVLTGIVLLVVSLWLLNLIAYFASETLGGRWAARSRARRGSDRLRKGVMFLFAGKSKQAKEQFLKAANLKQEPAINALLAAHSAIESEQYDRALNILNNLQTEGVDADAALMHTKAKVLVQLGKLEQAESLCRDIKSIQPKDSKTDLLLLQIAAKNQDWKGFQQLLPKLRNAEGVKMRVSELEHSVALRRLQEPNMSRPEYDEVVSTIPADIKNTAEVVQMRMHYLVRLGASGEAEKLMREFLHKEWRADLLRDYVSIPDADNEKQLTQLKKWHHRHGDSPELLTVLEELSDETGDWRSAQEYSRAPEKS